MRSARQREEHRAALDRRLEQLQAELTGTRPAPPDDEPDPPARSPGSWYAEDEPADAAALPVPGRHAARRPQAAGPLGRAEAAAPEGARPAVQWALAPAHLRVIAVLVVLALVASGWWLLRSRPEAAPREVGLAVSPASPGVSDPATDPAVDPDPSAAPTDRPGEASRAVAGADDPDGSADEGGEVIVHVAGRVRKPGIVHLPAGARVVDAVEAAGGPRSGVALRDLNLARALVDGEQVLVGLPGQTAAAGPAPPATTAGEVPGVGATATVNLNTADEAELETLPGVGPVTAGKIIAWREEHGRFSAVEELLEIDGIGDATLADLAPLVTV